MNSLLQIPLPRLILYCGSLALIPIALVFFSHQTNRDKHQTFAEEQAFFYDQILIKEAKESNNNAIQDLFQNPDHHYVGNHIETWIPLQKETLALRALLGADEAGVDEYMIKRLAKLEQENVVSFSEGKVTQFGTFQETIETLSKEVEVNEHDVASLLKKIESPDITKRPPQLLITKFQLVKKPTRPQTKDHIFRLKIEMIAREFFYE